MLCGCMVINCGLHENYFVRGTSLFFVILNVAKDLKEYLCLSFQELWNLGLP
jgi:hypothetical protein